MIEQGKVVVVTEHDAGSEVKEVAAVNSSLVTIEDSFDFEESGGTLEKEDGTQLAYTSVDTDNEIITLAAPLTTALAIGDKLYTVPRGRSKRAMVDLEDDTEGIKAGIRAADFDIFPTGIRDEDDMESVTLSDETGNWTIIDQDDEVPMRDLSLADPATMPVPEVPPAEVSPTPTYIEGPAAAIIQWDYIPQRVDIYLAFSDTAPIDATTLYDTNVVAPYWIYNDAQGNPITPSQTPFVALWAAGAPAPSAWVPVTTGQIPDAFMTVLAGAVIAQRLSGEEVVGAVLRGGELDIAGALHAYPGFLDITAQQLTAMAATFGDNLTILGQNNKLAGGLELGTGVSNPTSKVSVSSADWTSVPFGTVLPDYFWGLCDSPDGVEWWVVQKGSVGVGASMSRRHKTTGAGVIARSFSDTLDFWPDGGITRIGNFIYILGKDSNRNDEYWVRTYEVQTADKSGVNVTLTFIREWKAFNTVAKKPHIGTYNGEIIIAWMSSNLNIRWRTYNATTGAQTRDIVGATVYPDRRDIWAITQQGSDYVTIWINGYSPGAYNIDQTVRQNAEDFVVPPTSFGYYGLWWDGTRMNAVTDFDVKSGSRHPGGSFDYAWSQVDSDLGGGGVAETMISSKLTSSVVARFKRPVITIPAPQDDGTTDGANTGAIYAGPAGGTLRRQNGGGANLNANNTGAAVGGELVEPNKTLTLDRIETAGTSPWNVVPATTNGFALRASSAPGFFFSAKQDGGLPVIDVRGDGLAPRIRNLRMVRPHLRRQRDTTQTFAVTTWEAHSYNIAGKTEGITVTSNNTFTIVRPGEYEVYVHSTWDATGVARRIITAIAINGNRVARSELAAPAGTNAHSQAHSNSIKRTFSLLAGDTVQGHGWQSGGSSATTVNTLGDTGGEAQTFIEITYMGESS